VLIATKRAGDRRLWHGAAAAAPLLAAALLAGCSGLAATTEDAAPPAPNPSYREMVANRLKSSFKNSSSYDSFEISEPRWVHSVKGWNWLACVRFLDRGHRRTYAVFFDGSAVVDDRLAVQTDDCDRQGYGPFERMGGTTLDPLH